MLSSHVREFVLRRDGFLCQECRKAQATAVDHIWPRHRGGTDAVENLRAICKPCNSRKRAAIPMGVLPLHSNRPDDLPTPRWAPQKHDYPLDDIHEIRTELARLTAQLETQLRELVAIARGKGYSWEDIGRALGVARQNAWEKYGKGVEEPHRPTS
jgi:DNA-directed RNA polymerase specialized sigma24 family protein